jgi:serine/threonine-protein kinase
VDKTLSDPLVGRLLDGRYQVGRRLARGGMATVYEALDTRLERTVAIKVMHSTLAADPAFVSRFIREARSAARLSHPNIVAVYDQGTDGDATFLAMEYVDGVTLRDVLRQRGALNVADALAIMEQILGALAAAHRGGIVHRDVKPENVLLTSDGRVKVADFGLARAVTGAGSVSTLTGNVIIGTVAYLAPELVERGVADARSDVYAAGIVLFEMLTGAKPYVGDSPIQVAFRHVHETVPAPSTLVPDLPRELDVLVARATARSPQERLHDASAMLEAVTRAREGRPLLLNPLAPLEDGDPTVRTDRTDRTLTVERPAMPPAAPVASPATPAEPVTAAEVEASRNRDAALPPAARRSRRRGWLLLIFVLLLGIALLVGSYWWAIGRYSETPSLVHKTQSQAEQMLAAVGLHAQVTEDFSETVPSGSVISTDPAPHERVLDGGTVTLVVSQGPQRFAVPDVAGMTVEAATEAIEELPLTVSTTLTEEYHDTIATGLVVRTIPPIGEKSLKAGATVSLVVSKGPEPVAVPTVVGKSLADAQAALAAAGLKETHEATEYSDTVPEGAVVSQSIHDTTALPGTTVELVISKGPQLFAVPDVRGMDKGDAEAKLRQAGFGVKFSYPLGLPFFNKVRDQNPPPNSMVRRGTTITLSIV